MNAKEFYQNPQKWGNEEWDRIKPNTFTVSEMIDFAEAYHKEKMKEVVTSIDESFKTYYDRGMTNMAAIGIVTGKQ